MGNQNVQLFINSSAVKKLIKEVAPDLLEKSANQIAETAERTKRDEKAIYRASTDKHPGGAVPISHVWAANAKAAHDEAEYGTLTSAFSNSLG